MASNCTLWDGVAHVELKEVFAILADGVAKEVDMEAAGASKEVIEEEWLPGRDTARTRLLRLSDMEVTAVQELARMVA
jgi:hypothetical protein